LLPQNIVYTVVNRADKKSRLDILKDISGFFNRAEMTAVMGPSGSGKSTLLDLLAGRKNQGASLPFHSSVDPGAGRDPAAMRAQCSTSLHLGR